MVKSDLRDHQEFLDHLVQEVYRVYKALKEIWAHKVNLVLQDNRERLDLREYQVLKGTWVLLDLKARLVNQVFLGFLELMVFLATQEKKVLQEIKDRWVQLDRKVLKDILVLEE